MKVMCIAEGFWDAVSNRPIKYSLVKVGHIYTVTWEQMEADGLYYSLEEFNSGIGFLARMFAPLSSIDETELIKERQLETI